MRRARFPGAFAMAVVCWFPVELSAQSAPEKPPLAPIEIGTGGAVASAAAPAAEGNPLWSIPISTLSATRDRPLFSPSRRPPPPILTIERPVSEATPPAPPAPPPFSLVGTIIGENSRIGIFFDENTKTTTRIRQGDGEAGWIVRTIDPHSAVVEANGRMVTLVLPQPSATDGPGGQGPRLLGIVKR